MVRQWQRNLRSEARGLDRSIRKIEQEEDKIRKDIQAMAKQGGDPKSIQMLAKSLIRSSKAKDRLYTSRSIMQSAVAELETTAATMRLSDSMSKSAEVMKQMNSLVRIPEMEESISSMRREMMRAGLIDELIDEGMEEMDGPDLEVEAEAEVDKVLDDLAIDASVRMAISKPQAVAAPAAATSAAVPDPQLVVRTAGAWPSRIHPVKEVRWASSKHRHNFGCSSMV
ncbi:chmp3 [Symbiodinium microadriaticum]|nr:chmp3 [Symbiodinium microadriaticum]CAE7848210.1 chmp3 [Symbiodinium sp. KB8]